jgi:hypothetical protein
MPERLRVENVWKHCIKEYDDMSVTCHVDDTDFHYLIAIDYWLIYVGDNGGQT